VPALQAAARQLKLRTAMLRPCWLAALVLQRPARAPQLQLRVAAVNLCWLAASVLRHMARAQQQQPGTPSA
jgi:hypothetical protein